MIMHDVFNLLVGTMWYTTGIVLLCCFALVVYLTIDLISQLLGRNE